MSRVRIGFAGGRRQMLDRVVCSSELLVFRCALKVVMAAERFVTGVSEF